MSLLVALLCPAPCDPKDYHSPGSSVHGILQARIPEWVAIPFSRDLPDPGSNPDLHCKRILYHLSHQEAQFSQMWVFFVLLNIWSIFTTWFILSIWTFSPGCIWIITIKPTLIYDYLLAVLIIHFLPSLVGWLGGMWSLNSYLGSRPELREASFKCIIFNIQWQPSNTICT